MNAKKGSIGLGRTKKQEKKRRGLIDRLIDKLPVDIRIPGYKCYDPSLDKGLRSTSCSLPFQRADSLYNDCYLYGCCQKNDSE